VRQFLGYFWCDRFFCVIETMYTTANMTSLVAPDNRNLVFADAGITNDHDPPWFSARTSWRASIHCYARLINRAGAAVITNFSVFTKVLVGHRLANWHIFFYGNRGTTFAKIFRSSVAAEL
jgi:hypothetical protein